MPKPSSNPDHAKTGGGGVEPGNYECKAAIYRNVKTDYKPKQPTAVLTCAVLDKDGDAVRGADDVEVFFPLGEKAMDSFHPGTADGPDDEASDAGDGVDAEGPTLYCDEEGAQINSSCGYNVFNTSLAKAGFPKELLGQSWAGNYVGIKFHLTTATAKECNDRFGLRLNTKPMADGGTVTYKIADKWLNPDMHSKTKAKDKTTKGKAGATADAPPPPPATAAGSATDAATIAKEVLAAIAAAKPGEANAIKSTTSLLGYYASKHAAMKKPSNKMAECQKLLKDAAWLEEAVADLGGFIDGQKVTFPEAED